jgi:antitoxin component HigA of HigAB toxin-antitoxin module
MKTTNEINIIDNWLDKHGQPEVDKFAEKNLAIVSKINTILKERNINKTVFAQMLDKKPSEVTKWLSGTHNITLKSIIKMETALQVDLIHVESVAIAI